MPRMSGTVARILFLFLAFGISAEAVPSKAVTPFSSASGGYGRINFFTVYTDEGVWPNVDGRPLRANVTELYADGQGAAGTQTEVFSVGHVIYSNGSIDAAGMSVTANASELGHLIISGFQATEIGGSGTLIYLKFTVTGTLGQLAILAFGDYTDQHAVSHPGMKFNSGSPKALVIKGVVKIGVLATGDSAR